MEGVSSSKEFSEPLSRVRGSSCLRSATVDRNEKEIKELNMAPTVTRNDITEAGQRISGSIERTPLIQSAVHGQKIWLKCECLQTGGAFKLRGASNRLLQLSEEEKKCGVVAFSSGNHARGVAIAARRLGIRAVIVMPSDAPGVKVAGTRDEGAEIIFYDRYRESREDIAARISSDTGATVVPSFDDVHIVAGQGTVGLEILEQMPESPQRIIIPCGGGGLASGISLACPNVEVVIVEPEGWDDMKHSLAGGEIVPVSSDAPATLCDALQTPRVSPITFGILRERKAKAVTASDRAVRDAVRWAWDKHQLLVEPGGAIALAALLSGVVERDEGTVVVLSGGNVDPALHAEIVAGQA
jgi:threonine dehydratase